MNKVLLSGRETRDMDIKYTQGDKPMCIARGTLAVERRGAKKENNEQTADFINIVAFGKVAEFFEKYGTQGTKFIIEGRIQTGSYTNKDGQKVYTTEVVVENVEFAESKKTGTPQDATPTQAPATGDGFVNIPDGVEEEGLPFN